MRLPQNRNVRRTLLLGLVAVVGVSAWVGWGRGEARSVEDTVRAFAEARQAGDCDRLFGLLSAESRSDGGRLGRDEFLEQCEAVVDDYQPPLREVEVVSEDGEDAVVNVAVDAGRQLRPGRQEGIGVTPPQEADLAYETARLVREDGQWKVEADHRFLRIGRSVEQTVRGFANAYDDMDCERLVDHLSERLWSDGGQRSRDAYLGDCAEAAEARQALPDHLAAVGEPDAIEVAVDADTRRTATARWRGSAVVGAPAQTVTLTKEGLEWKLDSLPATVGEIDLATRAMLEAPLPGFQLEAMGRTYGTTAPLGFVEIDEGSDVAERRAEAAFERGVLSTFRVDDQDDFTNLAVALYAFEDAEGAAAYAELLARRIAEQADLRSPVPGPSGAPVRGAVVDCGSADDSCQRAQAAAGVAVDGRFLTAVEIVDDRLPTAAELMSQVEEVLGAQLERL